jgi:3-deoxy-D-manno-octulosonic-acid transferase
MAIALYNLGISAYSLIIQIAGLFNQKAKLLVEGRKETWAKLEKFSQENHENVFWFHAASLGEFEQGRPIIERLKKTSSSSTVLLSFFSPSGFEVRKNYVGADMVVYLPSDNARNAHRFLDLTRPKAALFIKYEFWYHYLRECSNQKVLTLSVSSIFRPEQPFFKFYGGLHRNMLKCFDHIFVQDEKSEALLKALKLPNLSVSGDTRFDRVIDISAGKKDIQEIDVFKQDEQLMVLGSVWPSDMEVLLPLLMEYKNELKFAIAPHNIGEKDVMEIMSQLGTDAIRYSKVNNQSLQDYRFLVIDNMGMLSALYGYGEFAYVGGAFRQTLHNTLEAAVHGIPVFFGFDDTNVKFREAIELEKTGGGISIEDTSELIEKFRSLFEDEEQRQKLGKIASEYVTNNTGATEMIVNYLAEKRKQ